MDLSAELSLTVENRLAELAEFALEVERFLQRFGVPEPTILVINLAIEELLTNTVKYGHGDDLRHAVKVRLSVVDNAITVAIEDDAKPFDPFARAPVDTAAPLDDRRPGGLGLHLIKEMIERVDYRRVADRNFVTLCQPFTAISDDGAQKENVL